jgi:hypothetical protein
MHELYEEAFKRPHDFRVKYNITDREDKFFQGTRFNFSFENDDDIYLIIPEFEDNSGNVILDLDQIIDKSGTARMYVISSKTLAKHVKKIKSGVKGFFREGRKIIGNCKII